MFSASRQLRGTRVAVNTHGSGSRRGVRNADGVTGATLEDMITNGNSGVSFVPSARAGGLKVDTRGHRSYNNK